MRRLPIFAACLLCIAAVAGEEVLPLRMVLGGSVLDVAVSGNRAIAAERGRVTLLDVRDPASPVFMGSTMIDTSVVTRVALDGGTGRAVVTWEDAEWYMDKHAPSEEESIYAGQSVAVLDLEGPSAPRHAATLIVPGFATAVAVVGDWAYIAWVSPTYVVEDAGLSIYDVSDPDAPVSIAEVPLPPYRPGEIAVSGNIVHISTTALGNAPIHRVNLTNPQAPTVDFFDQEGAVFGMAVDDGRLYIKRSRQVGELGRFQAELAVIHWPSEGSPTLERVYPLRGNIPQSGPLRGLVVAGQKAYVTVGRSTHDARDTSWLATVDLNAPEDSAVQMQAHDVFLQSLALADGWLYAACASAGLMVHDLGPGSPVQTAVVLPGELIRTAFGPDFHTAYSARGLFIYDYAGMLLGTYPLAGTVSRVVLEGTLAYAITLDGVITILDLHDPAAPTFLNTGQIPEAGFTIHATPNQLYALGHDAANMDVLNVYALDPATLAIVGQIALDFPGAVLFTDDVEALAFFSMHVINGMLYVDTVLSVHRVDVRNPAEGMHAHPVIVDQLGMTALHDDFLYAFSIATGSSPLCSGLKAWRAGTPGETPFLWSDCLQGGELLDVRRISVDRGFAFLTYKPLHGPGRLLIRKTGMDPEGRMLTLADLRFPANSRVLQNQDSQLYAFAGRDGLQIYDYTGAWNACDWLRAQLGQWPPLATLRGLDPDGDATGDGVPEAWTLALVEHVLCDPGHTHHDAVTAALLHNAGVVGAYNLEAAAPESRALLAALLLTSSAMEAPLQAQFYDGQFVVVANGQHELFSGAGDLDGDGYSNAQEYAHILANGGDRYAFAHAATQPGLGGGEGEGEGEGAINVFHSADADRDYHFGLGELLRVIQFFNTGGLHCALDSEDGYAPGMGDAQTCPRHSSDYDPADWRIQLNELLRLIQYFNMGGYYPCPDQLTEDGFCPAA